MRLRLVLLLAAVPLLASSHADPPYGGTVWVSPNILTPDDPTAFTGYVYDGRDQRTIYDRRSGWITIQAYLFTVSFDDGTTSEFIVNPEFGSREAAEEHVARYAPPIGQLSTTMRKDMWEVWINGGDEAAGGGNNSILLHTEYGERHLADGFLEEVLIHESGHTSFDAEHAQNAYWAAAQRADPEFISTYARDNPIREDISETLLLWYAVRHRPDRISAADYDKIVAAIPNRLNYLDGIQMDWHPMVNAATSVEQADLPTKFKVDAPYPNPFSDETSISVTMESPGALQAVVVDLLGRRVARIDGGALPAGPEILRWDGRDDSGVQAAPGVYLIQVTAGGQSRVVSTTLLR